MVLGRQIRLMKPKYSRGSSSWLSFIPGLIWVLATRKRALNKRTKPKLQSP